MRTSEPVVNFFLYGESPRPVDPGFLHVESLEIRSRAAGWHIQPHAHRDLVQVFLVEQGGGEMQADGGSIGFRGPCLILLPPRTIHAFAWAPEPVGRVLTLGANTFGHLRMRAPELGRLFAASAISPIADPAAVERLEALLRRLTAESVWDAPAHAHATEALLMLVLVEALRIVRPATEISARDAALVAEVRALIEESFRDHPPFAAHLARLGVPERRLREACRRVAGRTPMQMMLDRTMLEARRMLLSSNRTAADVGYELGFADPAYFSRVFRAHVGQSLRGFRKSAQA